MVSEPIAPAAPRADVPLFWRDISSNELRRKIERNAVHNQRRRESAADTWAKWYLPAVRESIIARASLAAGVRVFPKGSIREGREVTDREELEFAARDGARAVEVHAVFIKHTLAMIPVNAAWIEQALAELKRRESK